MTLVPNRLDFVDWILLSEKFGLLELVNVLNCPFEFCLHAHNLGCGKLK